MDNHPKTSQNDKLKRFRVKKTVSPLPIAGNSL